MAVGLVQRITVARSRVDINSDAASFVFRVSFGLLHEKWIVLVSGFNIEHSCSIDKLIIPIYVTLFHQKEIS